MEQTTCTLDVSLASHQSNAACAHAEASNSEPAVFHAGEGPEIPYGYGETIFRGITFAAKIIFFPVTIPFEIFAKSVCVPEGLADARARLTHAPAREKLHKEYRGTDIRITTDDEVTLEAMHFSQPDTTSSLKTVPKTVIVCSGSHKSCEYYDLPIVESLLQMGHNVVIFNYRGFGESQGDASEDGIYHDTEAVYQWVKSLGATDASIVAYGYSLGGGAATDLAARHPIDLVLDRTFSSMSDVASGYVRSGLGWAARLLSDAATRFDNVAKAKYVKGRVFIAQERDDDAGHSAEHLAKLVSAFYNAHHKVHVERLSVGHLHNGELPDSDRTAEDDLWFSARRAKDPQRIALERFLRG